MFLTNKANYKERHLAEEANDFIQGEFFRANVYDLMSLVTRDSCGLGDGLLKVFPQNKKVCVERTLETELPGSTSTMPTTVIPDNSSK